MSKDIDDDDEVGSCESCDTDIEECGDLTCCHSCEAHICQDCVGSSNDEDGNDFCWDCTDKYGMEPDDDDDDDEETEDYE